LVLAFFEGYDRNLGRLGEPIDRLDVFIADLAKGSGRRNRELPLPAQENADLSHRLEFGHIRLQEDAVNRTAPQCHVIPEPSTIVRHNSLCH